MAFSRVLSMLLHRFHDATIAFAFWLRRWCRRFLLLFAPETKQFLFKEELKHFHPSLCEEFIGGLTFYFNFRLGGSLR